MKRFNVLAILTLIVVLGLTTYNKVATQAVDPEVTTNLALEQFADPSVETDTAQRMYNRLDVTTVVNVGTVCLLVLVWGVSYRKELLHVGRIIVE